MYISATMVSGRAEPESGKAGAPRVRMLFLGANPEATARLRIDRGARGIGEKLRAAAHRDSVRLVVRSAVRVDDLVQALLEEQPDVVHFSGHGTEDGEIILERDDGTPKPIGKGAFASLFDVLKDRVRVVVLNANRSRDQGRGGGQAYRLRRWNER